jgi:hypothetical protein
MSQPLSIEQAREYAPFFISEGIKWAIEQQRKYLPHSERLSENNIIHLENYFGFTKEILHRVRIAYDVQIPNPDFYKQLEENNISIPLNFNNMAGITFGNLILIKITDKDNESLLFHELVHVAQYDFLGIPEFMKQYIAGWLDNNMSYYDIPLERHAYHCQSLYEKQFPIDVYRSVIEYFKK